MAKTAKAPDYTAAAEATGQSSKEVTNMQTWANRPDQVTPFGTTTWAPTAVKDPATGQMVTKWTQNTSLPEDQQKALMDQFAITSGRSDIAKELLPRAADEFGTAMDYSNTGSYADTPEAAQFQSQLGDDVAKVGSGQRYNQEAGDALMQQFDARNNPQNAQQEAAQDATLRARGMKPGDAAYDAELAKLRQSQSDARTNASFQASQLAGQEASRLQGMDQTSREQAMQEMGYGNQMEQQSFGNDQTNAAYQNTLHQSQLAEEMQKRGFSLNEINALISGQQVGMPTMPGFSQASKSETVDYSGAAKNQYAAAQAAADSQNAMTSGLMSAASSMIPS